MPSSVQSVNIAFDKPTELLSKICDDSLIDIGEFLDRSSLNNITKTNQFFHKVMLSYFLWDPFWLLRLNLFFPYTVPKKNKIELQFKEGIQFMINGGRNKGLTLSDANAYCKSNFEVVLRSVEQDGLALQYATNEAFKKNPQIGIAALKQTSLAWQYIDESLKNNLAFIKKAIRLNPKVYQEIKLTFRNKREVAIIAIQKNGLLLKNAASFISDRQMVIEAVRQNPSALQYAAEKFKKNLSLLAISAQSNDQLRSEKCDDLLKQVPVNSEQETSSIFNMVNLGLFTMALGAVQLAIAVTLLTTYAAPALLTSPVIFALGASLYFFSGKNEVSDLIPNLSQPIPKPLQDATF